MRISMLAVLVVMFAAVSCSKPVVPVVTPAPVVEAAVTPVPVAPVVVPTLVPMAPVAK
jgi:hypothetical protein